jgi:hypothetical protein
MSKSILFRRKRLVKGILFNTQSMGVFSNNLCLSAYTIERIMTHGRLKDFTISIVSEVLPEPELPATPTILMSAHGGE